MEIRGKRPWGNGLEISTEVVNGLCPNCDQDVILVSLFNHRYRCVNCGGDLQQKVNGVISYIPIGASGTSNISLTRLDGQQKT